MKKDYRLIAICLANFIWSFGSFVNVVFVFYIPAKFNTNELQTGIVMSLVSVAIFCGTLIYPKLIYRYSPIDIYKYAVALGAVCFLGAAIWYDRFFVVVPLILISYITFSLTRSLNKKIISLAITSNKRRTAYSYAFAVANFGGVFSGILAPFIFNINIDYMRYIFLVNFVFTISSYLILSFGVATATNQVQEKPVQVGDVKFKIDKRLLIATSAIYFGFFQLSYLIPRTIEHYYSLHIYSLVIVINTLMCVFAAPISIKILGQFKVSEYLALKTGALLMILAFALYNIISIPVLILTTVIFAIGEVLFITNLDSYLLKMYSFSEYDHILISVRMLAQVNRAIGPLVTAICIMYFSYQAAFVIVIIYMLVGLVPLHAFNRDFAH